MPMKTYKATFEGHVYTRRTEATYPYAAFNPYRRDFRPRVTFHKTYAAAKRRAGEFGEVARTVGA